MMLEKMAYKELLSHAFDIPISVTYWDGSIATYGEGTPNIAIPHTESEFVKTCRIVPVKLNHPITFHNMIAPDASFEVRFLFMRAPYSWGCASSHDHRLCGLGSHSPQDSGASAENRYRLA